MRQSGSRELGAGGRSVRVLIVDDFALMRDGVAAALDVESRIEVVGTAGDGIEAFELASELRPDVLVLDLRMSDRGGMETLGLCAEHLPATRVLILTANENPSNLRAALAAGASGFLTKGVEAKELRDAVIAVHGGETVVDPDLAARLRVRPGPSADAGAEPELTARERRIMRLLSGGATDREIAAELFVAVRTVQYDLASVRRKTGLSRRSELARWAVIHSLD